MVGYSIQTPIFGFVAYIFVQQWLRFRRQKKTEQHYRYPSRKLGSMTETEAQKIQSDLANLEFPLAFKKALQFALFRTYGIPSISKLLVKTQQLSECVFAPKRYTDTVVLIDEIYAREPTHPRVREAFGRLNYLHGIYRHSGHISNDDMLYTLSLFGWEPVKWINRIEWRQLTDLEVAAIGTFLYGLGDGMKISYEALPSCKSGFSDGLHFMHELSDWADAYEERCMLPHVDNHKTAEETTALLVREFPESFRPRGKIVVTALMDERLRVAMMYDKPPKIYKQALDIAFSLRKYLLRYLALPRPYFMRRQTTLDAPSAEGRYFLNEYDAYPFYVKPTFASRFGPAAFMKRLVGVPLPGDDGDVYGPKGYKIEDIGPKIFLGKGAAESKSTQAELLGERTGGCPFRVL